MSNFSVDLFDVAHSYSYNIFQHTHSTRVRLAILSAFGEAFVKDNKDSTYRLIAHESRPSLTLIPAQGSDKRPVSYRFIEAVQRLTPNFPKDTWSKLYEKVGARLHMGQLKRTFVILSDEDRASGRDSGLASGANSVPVSGRGGRRGGRGLATRGGRGGHDGSGPSNKRGPEDILSATPAKTTRRGK